MFLLFLLVAVVVVVVVVVLLLVLVLTMLAGAVELSLAVAALFLRLLCIGCIKHLCPLVDLSAGFCKGKQKQHSDDRCADVIS